ncbi:MULTISPECIES: polysaccharide deacetylase family protein [unclassified Ruegeria]|uniref:polysaccharide deacetylase family protein n=1 Tax=unclassified Ruegeria TaxID=2625375 RepID=UPI001491E2DD|nr:MULTISPECIES: polysaccharide deacetylase family protein [unclassified Ruegeria]NOD78593.1 polysaccharide deacetylase family protein [Ruegeria sp. HKCCD4332]NOD90966.1 polysaccharide deacetylase family protein [Ruegeria sp. HKCCD4318]NOE16294.1 polysaccharide deacetylase family protein [Ruegeria sp. HKCCD4318-2]NOG11780.1 polysaccharide deacetylase family protein [Ruegeria sp. HKCCD4315]
MPAWQADILMYHSISDAPGPTSIAPEVFKAQMQALAASGLPVVTPDALANPPAPRVVIISFDDGFEDFADTAWPILRDHNFTPIVYLPSGRMGGSDSWAGGHVPPRPLMGWDKVAALAEEGVCFGAHSISHPDLTTLDPEALEDEITGPGQDITARLDQPIRHFAPPYGASNPDIRARVARNYDTSVGTRLGVAKAGDDMHDLPRLEMFYFTDIARWKAHLAGRGGPYLAARKLMRNVRAAIRGKPW